MMRNRLLLFFPNLWPCFILAMACAAEKSPSMDWEGETMGSSFHIKTAHARLASEEWNQIKKEVQSALDEVNRQMSHYRPDSELSRLNLTPPDQPFKISPDFLKVMNFSLELHQNSKGAFDPCLGTLIDLWGFGAAQPKNPFPTESERATAIKNAGMKLIKINPDGSITKLASEVRLNVSAVAKGFAVDQAARVLQRHGVRHYMVEIGGEVYAAGFNGDSVPWRIGIEKPQPDSPEATGFAGVIPLSQQALATSGNYRKYVQDASNRIYSHIFDPRTGNPAQNDVVSASVISDNCLIADGLATSLMVLGRAQGKELIKLYPGSSALFIYRDGSGNLHEEKTQAFPEFLAFPMK